MNKVRSYADEVVYRIEQLRARFNVAVIGNVSFGRFAYPVYRIIAEGRSRSPKKDVLISGIVHGDEPAGGFAALRFLDQLAESYLDRFRFFCYPCVNPSGFETDMRVNMDYVNLNRSCVDPPTTQEFKHILESLKQGPSRYCLTVDMHECGPQEIDPKEHYGPEDNPHEFWMWETALADSGLRVGDKVVRQLASEGVPICRWPTIYGDKNSDGVIWYPDGCDNEFYAAGTSLEGYLYSTRTNHSFTVETPTFWSLDRRVNVHVRALSLILDLSA